MATAEQLKALIQSYTKGEDSRFLSVAAQIAAHAARAGKGRLADDIRKLIDEAKQTPREQRHDGLTVPIAQPTGDLAGLVAASYPKTRLADMVLDAAVEIQLTRVIREYREADRLRRHGLPPRRKLLLVGPPGCGKTMTASAIAGELGMPLLCVQFHTLMTKFMGETAAKLHLIFESMKQMKSVYLFDEFDAIGVQRASLNDVGEIRRVLNSFLLFLEQDDSDSIIIAATNLSTMLDDALFRRFDDVVTYAKPSSQMARELVQNRLSMFDCKRIGWKRVLDAARSLNHADIVRACEDAAKVAVLDERNRILTDDLVDALKARRPSSLS